MGEKNLPDTVAVSLSLPRVDRRSAVKREHIPPGKVERRRSCYRNSNEVVYEFDPSVANLGERVNIPKEPSRVALNGKTLDLGIFYPEFRRLMKDVVSIMKNDRMVGALGDSCEEEVDKRSEAFLQLLARSGFVKK